MKDQYPKLIIIEGPSAGQSVPITKTRMRIGRSSDNEIIINDRLSSRTHSLIKEIDGSYYIADQDSRNGTFLNDRQVQEELLHDGDEIRIGNTVFQFSEPGSKSQSTQGMASTQSEFSEDDFTLEEEEYNEGDKALDWKTLALFPIVLIVLGVLYYYTTQEKEVINLRPIPLPAKFSYGYIPNGDQKHADKVVYVFEFVPGELTLSYKVWDIDRKGEVNIYLNREKIAEVEPTESGHWSGLRKLKLPPELLSKERKNYIVFDNPRNPPRTLMWGVAEVDVRPEEDYPCEPTKAKLAYELGKKSYEDKKVVRSNLYHAIEKFTEADKFLKNCQEKPEFYFDNKLKLDEATRELDVQYRNHLFEYNKNKKLRRYEQAAIELRFLKELIPNPADERHIRIKREERYLMRVFGK